MLPIADPAFGHAIILPYARDGTEVLISVWLRGARRKDLVTAQYATQRAARDYARGHDRPHGDGQHLRARIELILGLLAQAPGGTLLDAGCGPGVLARTLLRSPRHGFQLTVLDQSQAMVSYCVNNAEKDGKLAASVGDLQALPFGTASFDVTLATGVLEYLDARAAIGEISRVTRQGGIAIASMLNPFSPYRLTQWFLYWPALRAIGAIEKVLGLRRGCRHGAAVTGIRALRPGSLRRRMRQAGFTDVRVIYFDPTVLVPPFDRHPAIARIAERMAGAVAWRGLKRWLCTGYLVTGRRV